MSAKGVSAQYRDSVPYEYQHSLPVDPKLYDNDNYLFNVRPRVNSFANVSDTSCFEVRDDWKAATGKEHKGAGCMDPVNGNMAALDFPEATKERLFALAFVNEFIFIQDDYLDVTETSEMDSAVDQFSWNDPKSNNEIHRSIKAVQAKVLAQLLQDEVAGGYVVDEIKKLTEEQAFTRHFDFKNGSIEEYIEFRHRDVGTYYMSACTGFGVVPTIAPSEVESVLDITKIGYACAMLCNDYWSWDKEFEDFTGEGNWPVNSVYLYMQKHNVDANTAKEMVKVKTMELAQQYGDQAVKCVQGLPIDSPIVRWFGLLDMVIAGNALWSITCPRYHRDRPQLCRDQLPAVQDDVDKMLPFRDVALSLTPPPEDSSKHETSLVFKDYLPSEKIYEKIIMEPFEYITSLPAKGLRDHLLEALNTWFGLEEGPLSMIKDIINTLHNVSLMLDDIEDNTSERRGHPATHMIFGIAQTINSAGYAQMMCLEKVMSLGSRGCLDAYLGETKAIYTGQALDLHWTYHSKAPSEKGYFDSIDMSKTGGLLRLMAKLIQAYSIDLSPQDFQAKEVAENNNSAQLFRLVVLIGRYYQVRDDLKDIKDARSAPQCDLDQGNFTLPVIHFLAQERERRTTRLLSMLQARKEKNGMSPAMKNHVLDLLEKSGSLDYTSQVLKNMYQEILDTLSEVEAAYSRENRSLRKLLEMLKL
ncbi:uncharacterized protein PAC_08782 [Phialocephala subalpina]|uniref:Uncharacterized protein n=1 Tax=Phialocephala subalpina TaxID=576137 RepID=A0A1L7X1K4_9HELO|nr:uncharacterized protein PAC_08782 [Phialocephala subalpina]